MSSDYSGYKRALWRYFEVNDLVRTLPTNSAGGHLDEGAGFGPPNRHRNFRIEAYLRDSLLWSIEELELGHNLYAFRGLLQAAAYAGQVGHDSITGDCFTTLRNDLEDVICAPEVAKQVVQDCMQERDIFGLVDAGRALLRFIRSPSGRRGTFEPSLEEDLGRALDRAEEWSPGWRR